MKKKKIKILILIVFILFIIVSVIIFNIGNENADKIEKSYNLDVNTNGNDSNNEIITYDPNESLNLDNITREEEKRILLVDSDFYYLNVKNCIEKYNQAICSISNNFSGSNQKAYNILDEQYINKLGITRENISSKILVGNYNFYVESMYMKKEDLFITSFVTFGIYINNENNDVSNYGFIVRIDEGNNLFSVMPYDYIQKYGVTGNNFNSIQEVEIRNTSDNQYDCEMVTDYKLANSIYIDLKCKLVYNTDSSYYDLYEKYSREKFDSLENFKEYINQNKEKIEKSYIKKYEVNYETDHTEIIIKNTNDDEYTILEYSSTDYKIMLDNYTTETEEGIKRYNAKTYRNKIEYNITKIEKAINKKDYRYLYSKLNETFRKNNFSSQNDLGEYINLKMFEENNYNINSISENDGVYVIIIYVKNNENATERTLKIIMKLEDNANYQFSFSIT